MKIARKQACGTARQDIVTAKCLANPSVGETIVKMAGKNQFNAMNSTSNGKSPINAKVDRLDDRVRKCVRPVPARKSIGKLFCSCFHIMVAMVVAASIVVHADAQGTTNAPLWLSINGGGSVSPFTNGESLVVGESYNMVATPDAGYAFYGWQPVNFFTFTEITLDANGNTNLTVSTIASPAPIYTNQPTLNFIMQPVVVLFDVPGVRSVTESTGWQVDFAPIILNIQLGYSNVIVTWSTNLANFTLQSATDPVSPVWTTNLPAPVVVNGEYTVTNCLCGEQQFFRLSQ